MSAPNDGGPAFPMQDSSAIHAYAMARLYGVDDADEQDRVYVLAKAEAIGGMSLRDWFAGHALAGLAHGLRGSGYSKPETAKLAYGLADAMLAERERKGAE